MQLHQLKPNKRKKKKRIGRGGKKGTYSGRGVKGQKARAGNSSQPVIRELIKKYHKLRGYRQGGGKKGLIVINLDLLEKHSQEGEIISPEVLVEKGLARKVKGKLPSVKILGEGKISKKIIVKDCKLSSSAKEKIKKSGGKIS